MVIKLQICIFGRIAIRSSNGVIRSFDRICGRNRIEMCGDDKFDGNRESTTRRVVRGTTVSDEKKVLRLNFGGDESTSF